MLDHADLLCIAGIDHNTFYNGGEDVRLERDEEEGQSLRIFRKGGKLVYRAGSSVDWFGEDQKAR
jgi:hypothetical protein